MNPYRAEPRDRQGSSRRRLGSWVGHTLAVTYGLLPFGELFLTGRADRVDLAAGTLFVVLVVSNWCQTRALDSHDEEETRAAQRAAAP